MVSEVSGFCVLWLVSVKLSVSASFFQEYTDFCLVRQGKKVPWSDRLEFLNGWYILIIASDTLTIIGSILKIEIQTKVCV